MIEVEKRGQLTQEQYVKLKELLENDGELVSRENQLNIFIEFNSPFLGDLENTKASINISFSKDLESGQTKCRLKSKSGNMKSSSRLESEIHFNRNEYSDVLKFLQIFEIMEGCPRFYYREDYKYKNFLVTTKQKGLAPDHFEIELQVDEDSEVEKALSQIDELCEKLGLKAYSEDEYKEIMLEVFEQNPPIPLSSVDLGLID